LVLVRPEYTGERDGKYLPHFHIKTTNIMKKILSLLFALLLSSSVYSQTTITSSFYEICDFNLVTGSLSEDCSGLEKSSVFTINKEETEIVHRTDGIISTYSITDASYNEEEGEVTLRVVGLLDQEYLIVIDLLDANVKVFFKNEVNDIIALVYLIDNIYR
jgi:hypothetical protein